MLVLPRDVASEEREVLDKPSGKAERSTAVDMTASIVVISTKRSAWRDSSTALGMTKGTLGMTKGERLG
jgi:hypothetical protein